MGGQVQARKGGLGAVCSKLEKRSAEWGWRGGGEGKTKGMGRSIRKGRGHWKVFKPKKLDRTETRGVTGQVL